jgi:hypothetical protein
MSEPITIYAVKDGEPIDVYGQAQLAALLASGDYVIEKPVAKKPAPEAKPEDEPATPKTKQVKRRGL